VYRERATVVFSKEKKRKEKHFVHQAELFCFYLLENEAYM
jgi:hypothetical protein